MANRHTKIDSSQISPIKPEDVSGQTTPQSGQVLSYCGDDNHFKWVEILSDDKYLIQDENTCIGIDCGRQITSGNSNSFYGYRTGYNNIYGNRNTAFGCQAGGKTAYDIDENIYVGYKAGYNNEENKRLFINTSDSEYALIHGKFDDREIEFGDDVDHYFFNFRESGNTSIIESPPINHDLYLMTHGSGMVRFGKFISSGGKPPKPEIVGYIQIKDEDGNNRKVAIIEQH